MPCTLNYTIHRTIPLRDVLQFIILFLVSDWRHVSGPFPFPAGSRALDASVADAHAQQGKQETAKKQPHRYTCHNTVPQTQAVGNVVPVAWHGSSGRLSGRVSSWAAIALARRVAWDCTPTVGGDENRGHQHAVAYVHLEGEEHAVGVGSTLERLQGLVGSDNIVCVGYVGEVGEMQYHKYVSFIAGHNLYRKGERGKKRGERREGKEESKEGGEEYRQTWTICLDNMSTDL